MAKHVHIHLHAPAKDAEITLKKSKVEEKCRNGEWESMQDIVANRTLQFRNTRNGRTFFVRVEYDAALSDFERNDIKKWYDFYKSKTSSELVTMYRAGHKVSSSFTAGEVGGKQGLIDMLLRDKFGQRRLEAFYNNDASSSEIQTLKDSIENLENEHEKKRDQGVTVTPADMKKLQDLRDTLKKLES